LALEGRVAGALAFVAGAARQSYDLHDLALAEELGRRAAVAVDRLRLYKEAHTLHAETERTAARSRRLQAITAVLSQSRTPEEVARAVVREAAAALDALFCAIGLIGPDGEGIELIAHHGLPDEVAAGWQR